MSDISAIMRTAPVIPVLVIDDVAHAKPMAEALVAGGLRVLEVTLRTDCALEAIAAMRGRDFVTPEDVQFVTGPVLQHRIILTPEKEMEGMTPEDAIRLLVEKVEVPR